MKRSHLLVLAVILAPVAALACRFNVRDVGFVNLGGEDYRFYCVVDSQTPAEQVEAIEQISAAAFLEANVEAKLVTLGGDRSVLPSGPESDGLRHYRAAGSPEPPIGILVSPDPRRKPLAIPLLRKGELLQESVWSAMEQVFESPSRDAVLAGAIESFGVIVLVEGADTDRNQAAAAAARKVIQRIGSSLGRLEKVIEKPPVLHVVPAARSGWERVFLWSLGLSGNTVPPEARVAVVYGRGRQIGAILEGAEITEKNLYNITATIGLNCECGLDRTWMQGTMMPIRWNGDTQTRVAKLLGFDAEDPKIKMEMSQILSKGTKARQSSNSGTGNDSGATGDEEVARLAATLGEQAGPGPPSAETRNLLGSEAMAKPDERDTPKTITAFHIMMASLVLVVMITGAVILLHGRSRSA